MTQLEAGLNKTKKAAGTTDLLFLSRETMDHFKDVLASAAQLLARLKKVSKGAAQWQESIGEEGKAVLEQLRDESKVVSKEIGTAKKAKKR